MARIVVVGSLNMDLVVGVERWPEGGETLFGRSFDQVPGGKGANQAAAAAMLGGHVAMVGRVGDDAFAQQLKQSLGDMGVDISALLSDADAPTGVAIIGVDAAGENRIVVVSGANARLTPDDVERSFHSAIWRGAQVLLLQCEIPVETVVHAARLGRERGLTVVLDPAPPVALPRSVWDTVDICTPNQGEARVLLQGDQDQAEDPDRLARGLARRVRRAAIVKLGERGAVIAEGDRAFRIEGVRVSAVDTTAAGDAFGGALAVALAEGQSLDNAVDFANHAAALSTTRAGAQPSMPHREEVEGSMGRTAGAG